MGILAVSASSFIIQVKGGLATLTHCTLEMPFLLAYASPWEVTALHCWESLGLLELSLTSLIS